MKHTITLTIAGNDPDQLPSTQEALAIKDALLKHDPDIEFRETDLKHYDEEMLTDERDRRNFMEDLYDWADSNDVWVEWRVSGQQ